MYVYARRTYVYANNSSQTSRHVTNSTARNAILSRSTIDCYGLLRSCVVSWRGFNWNVGIRRSRWGCKCTRCALPCHFRLADYSKTCEFIFAIAMHRFLSIEIFEYFWLFVSFLFFSFYRKFGTVQEDICTTNKLRWSLNISKNISIYRIDLNYQTFLIK